MRSRLSKLSKHFFYGTCCSAGLAGFNELRRYRFVSEKFFHNFNPHWSDERDEEEMQEEFKDQIQVIKQAYKDVGYKGKVYVKINTACTEETRGARTISSFDGEFKRSAFVEMDISRTAKNPLSNQTIYSIAGHEAIHNYYEHRLAQAALNGFLLYGYWALRNTPLIVFASYCVLDYFTDPFLSRQMERQADLASAKKLGTALLLAEDLERDHRQSKGFFESLKSSHPESKKRAKNLREFSAASHYPLLFNSEKLKQPSDKTNSESNIPVKASQLRSASA